MVGEVSRDISTGQRGARIERGEDEADGGTHGWPQDAAVDREERISYARNITHGHYDYLPK